MMRRALLLLAVAVPAIVQAHGLGAAGFLEGVSHPVGGADHLLAMVAVGIASTRGPRSFLWALPAVFLAGMAAGFVCGIANVGFDRAEGGVALSVLLLGLMVAQPWRGMAYATLVVVPVFGWCHGYAHGQEWPAHASPWAFALGFLGTTAGLHVIGVITGCLYLEQERPARSFVVTGLVIAATGVAMAAPLTMRTGVAERFTGAVQAAR